MVPSGVNPLWVFSRFGLDRIQGIDKSYQQVIMLYHVESIIRLYLTIDNLQIIDFRPKIMPKTSFFEDTNLDHLTSGWLGTHCFRGDANFDMFPKSMGKKLQNELWARPVASKLSERRPLTFFHRRDTEKCIFKRYPRMPYES